MKFKEAVNTAYALKRTSWTGKILRVQDDGSYIIETPYGNEPCHLSTDDLMATDWVRAI